MLSNKLALKGETGNKIGAHLWLESIIYFEFENQPSEPFVQSQIRGTKGEILPFGATGFSAPEHYEFKTWKTSENQRRDPGTEHLFLSELWLFPVWEPIQYKITYELNGGEFTTTYPTTYTIEDQNFTLINPSRTGYILTGWTGTGITGDDPVLEVTIEQGSTGDRTCTARWALPFRTLTDSATDISVSGYIRSDAAEKGAAARLGLRLWI
ncbi:MAG: hypothetical protein GX044_09005 [Firmicutes bacterium]|jgi:uncharacterized repeat protein (TIGR02543 family)|nr:hypothetical protein [Bacillota bacterium]